jgi:hypothetical protein
VIERNSFGTKYVSMSINNLAAEGQYLHEEQKAPWHTEQELEDQQFPKEKNRIQSRGKFEQGALHRRDKFSYVRRAI